MFIMTIYGLFVATRCKYRQQDELVNEFSCAIIHATCHRKHCICIFEQAVAVMRAKEASRVPQLAFCRLS